MLSLERHREILQLLKGQGRLRVTDTAAHFKVTEETIRRDLDRLERDGKLVRTHGGALPVRNERTELPFLERETRNLESKRAIARLAAARVREGDTLLLDASSTSFQLARLLPDLPLTVITNSIAVATELLGRSKIRVMSTGGLLEPLSCSYVGPFAMEALERYHAQRFFFSCKGVDPVRGLSEAWEEQAQLKRKMLTLATERVLMADHTKFRIKSSFFFGRLSEVSLVITDEGIDQELLVQLGSQSAEVVVASLHAPASET